MTPLRHALPFLPLALMGCGDGSSGGGPGPMSDAMVAPDSPPLAGAACRFEPGAGTTPVLAAVRQDELHVVHADGTARSIHRIADGLAWTSISSARLHPAGTRFVLAAEVAIDGLARDHREYVGFDRAGGQRWALTFEDAPYEWVYAGASGHVAIARFGQDDSLLVDPEGVTTALGALQPAAAPAAAPSAAGWVPVTRPAGGDARELGWRAPDGAFTSIANGIPMDVRWSDDTLVAVVRETDDAGQPRTAVVLARPGEASRRHALPDDAWSVSAANGGWALVGTFAPDHVYRIDVAGDRVETVSLELPPGARVAGAEQLFVAPGPGVHSTGALEHGLVIEHEVAVYRSPDGLTWTRLGAPFALTPPPPPGFAATPRIGWVERAGTRATFVTSGCEGCPEPGTVHVEAADGRTATIEGAATDAWMWDDLGASTISPDGECLAYFSRSPAGDETLLVRALGDDRAIELGVMPRLERATWSTYRPLWLTDAPVE